MKKLLFISNVSRKITNFSVPSILAGQRLGYEVHLAANYSHFDDEPKRYGVKIHHIDINRNPFSLANIKAYKQMLALIRREKYEVIHCNTPIGGVLGRLCGKRANVRKIIYTAHGFHFYKGAPIINRTLYKWAERLMARYTDVIITINKEDYEAAKGFRLRKNGSVYWIPGVGIDTTLATTAKSKRKELLNEIGAEGHSILLISVGELNRNKNHKAILHALAAIKDPRIHYILCGVGREKAKLESFVDREGLRNNIHFLGYRNDIIELLKSCDIFVLASYREGLPRAVMEAMSAGLPCVVSRVRGNVDLIENGKGGFLHDPDDIDGFAFSINTLVQDVRLRQEMGKNNIERIKDYDIEIVKMIMQNIYERELAGI